MQKNKHRREPPTNEQVGRKRSIERSSSLSLAYPPKTSNAVIDIARQAIRDGIANINYIISDNSTEFIAMPHSAFDESCTLVASSSADSSDCGMSLNNINSVSLDNETDSFTLLATSSDGKGSLDIILDNTTSFTLSAAAMSSTLTLQAAVTSFRVSAALMPSTVLAAVASSALPTAAISILPSISNSCKEGPSEARSKHAKKTSSIKLETKRLKWKRKKIAGDRVHCVSRSQNPMLFRHKRIIRGTPHSISYLTMMLRTHREL